MRKRRWGVKRAMAAFGMCVGLRRRWGLAQP